jgi:hypothetical protein
MRGLTREVQHPFMLARWRKEVTAAGSNTPCAIASLLSVFTSARTGVSSSLELFEHWGPAHFVLRRQLNWALGGASPSYPSRILAELSSVMILNFL